MKKYLVVILLVTTSLSAQTPRTVSTRNLFWGAVSLNWKFNPKWSLVSDALFRYEYTDGDIFQSGIRSGISYKTSNGIQLTAGGVFFLHYPDPNGKVPRPEIRGWEEIGRKFDFGIHQTFFPRIRLEQRYFEEYNGDQPADRFTFNSWRLRLRAEYSFSFAHRDSSGWSLVAGDELMFHRKPDGFTSMDQNRVWGGFAYKFNHHVAIQTTYIHIFQQRNSTLFDQLHVLRLTLQFSIQNRR